jgi:hypothetical protein
VDAVQDLIAMPRVDGSATIRSLIVYGEDAGVTYSVYSVAVATGVPTLLGSGTVGTTLDITDFAASSQSNYLLLTFVASTTSQTLFGGKLFTDDSGILPYANGILPSDFMLNDDG